MHLIPFHFKVDTYEQAGEAGEAGEAGGEEEKEFVSGISSNGITQRHLLFKAMSGDINPIT
ncbi:MAG: hypothetical protein KME22_20210 [Hassallia sp. WJT32-NPBG1]|jgi:hypothetical protein|nr:hypothetical protein [Hassallia sp. WJT32-NPBG1]